MHFLSMHEPQNSTTNKGKIINCKRKKHTEHPHRGKKHLNWNVWLDEEFSQ